MAVTDDQLLDFDAGHYVSYDEGKARELLAGDGGDGYRSQLVVARWIEGWRQRTLAQGVVEGGVLYTDAVGGWDEPR